MGIKLGDAILYLKRDDTDLRKGLSETRKAVSAWGKNVSKIAIAGLAAGAAAVGAGLTAAAVGVGKLVLDAAPIKLVQDSFEGLTSAVEGGAERMLEALKRGSSGVTTEYELMMQYNKAAQLISKDFASTLPDAMQYVSKVAASTGEDFNFLMNSYITGVGRMSPLILDNLSVQVDLADATERAAEMFGVQGDAITEDMKQIAMANIVLEKMAENTADIPDVAGSAMASWQGFTTRIKDFRHELGLKLLPLFEPLLKNLKAFADTVASRAMKVLGPFIDYIRLVVEDGDYLNDFLTHLPKSMQPFAKGLGMFISLLKDGEKPIDAFIESLKAILPESTVQKIQKAIEWFRNLFDTIREFVSEHKEEIIGALKAIGIFLGALAGVSIIGSIIAAIANPLTLVLGLVGLLGAAWTKDWGGIRTSLTAFWETTGRPIFQQLVEWLQTNLPIAIQTLKDFWTTVLWPALQTFFTWFGETILPLLSEFFQWLGVMIPQAISFLSNLWTNVLQPALQTVWGFIQGSIIPILSTLWSWLSENIPPAIETLAGFWTDTLQPALNDVWMFIEENIVPILGDLAELLGVTLSLAVEALAALWETVLQPAIEAVWEIIENNLIPIIERLIYWFQEEMMPVVETVSDFIHTSLVEGFNLVRDAIQFVIGKVRTLIEWFRRLRGETPTDYLPESPPPLAEGFAWVADEVNNATRAYRELGKVVRGLPKPDLAMAAVSPGARVGGIQGHQPTQISINADFPNVKNLSREDIEYLAYRITEFIQVRS